MGAGQATWLRDQTRRLKVLLLCAGMATCLGGCAAGTLTAGARLAAAGQTAADQMSQNVTISSRTYDQAATALAFLDGYNGAINASQPLLDQISLLQKNLGRYTRVLNDLGAAYGELGALSGYDSAGIFTTSVNGLSTDIDSLATALGSNASPIPSGAAAGIGAIGGQILTGIQARDVKRRSKEIEVQLGRLIALLQQDGVEDKIVPAEGMLANDMHQASQQLVDAGVFSYAQLADQVGAPFGLTSGPQADAVIKDPVYGPRVRRGLDNVSLALAQARIRTIRQNYEASLKLLVALQAAHAKLDRGEPLDLGAISDCVGQLRTLAAALKPPTAK